MNGRSQIFSSHWELGAGFAAIAFLIFTFAPTRPLFAQDAATVETSIQEYYISPDGSDSNAGTKEAPFYSFKKADSVVQPGDTVYVLPGIYEGYTAQNTIRIATSGVESARIRWISESKWDARIMGHVNHANGLGWGIVISGSYVDLIGFDVTSDANMGVWVLGTHVRVIGNHVHDIPGQPGCTSYGASGIEQGNYAGGHMEVIANVVHDIGAGGPGSCNKYHGIYLAAPFDTAVNNISYHNASKGIGTWHAATNNTISNNTVFDNDVGILVGAGDTPCFHACLADYMVVSNNIMYHNRTIGFWQYSKAGPHNLYTHNLVYANRVSNVLLQGGCGRFFAEGCNPFVKAIDADPLFVNPTGDFFTGDYRLKCASPALRAGTVVGAPPIDFNGSTRETGFAPDLGAYERDKTLSPRSVGGASRAGGDLDAQCRSAMHQVASYPQPDLTAACIARGEAQ